MDHLSHLSQHGLHKAIQFFFVYLDLDHFTYFSFLFGLSLGFLFGRKSNSSSLPKCMYFIFFTSFHQCISPLVLYKIVGIDLAFSPLVTENYNPMITRGEKSN